MFEFSYCFSFCLHVLCLESFSENTMNNSKLSLTIKNVKTLRADMAKTTIMWLEINFKISKFNPSVTKRLLLANFNFIEIERDLFLFGIFLSLSNQRQNVYISIHSILYAGDIVSIWNHKVPYDN